MSSLNNLIAAIRTKEHWITTSVLLWSVAIIILSAVYASVGIHKIFVIVLAATGVAGWVWLIGLQLPTLRLVAENWKTNVLLAASSLLSIGLLAIVWIGRTDDPLRSPWEIAPSWFFVVFALSLIMQVSAALREKQLSLLSIVALIAQSGVCYGIAVAAFRFGYAYDPLIHQTAEQFVVAHGKILPLQPFYIGQYALVAALHFVTNAPVWLIDRLLLPLLAIISVPIVGYVGLTRGWGFSHQHARIGLIVLSTLPLAEFTFTVPYNITVLYAFWLVLLLPLLLRSRIGMFTLVALSGAATMTHPLLGIPLLIAAACAIALQKYKNILFPVLCALGIGGSIFVMLGVYRLQHGLPFLATTEPLKYVQNFISIFECTGDIFQVRPAMQLVYGFAYVFPFVVAVYGVCRAVRDKIQTVAVRWTLAALMIGLVLAIFLVSTLISIPGVALHEQNEFMLRLRHLFPLFVLPLVVCGAFEWSQHQPRTIKYGALIVIVAVATCSLYFTYPRVDGVTRPGWNVSASDIAAVRGIHELAGGGRYMVLAHQVLSAAGLRELGFEHRIIADNFSAHTYPISIAEPHYELTQRTLYNRLDATAIQNLAKKIRGSVFVAVHEYWYRSPIIRQEALLARPSESYSFDQVTVFRFDATESSQP